MIELQTSFNLLLVPILIEIPLPKLNCPCLWLNNWQIPGPIPIPLEYGQTRHKTSISCYPA